jgi:hypothetical protein
MQEIGLVPEMKIFITILLIGLIALTIKWFCDVFDNTSVLQVLFPIAMVIEIIAIILVWALSF